MKKSWDEAFAEKIRNEFESYNPGYELGAWETFKKKFFGGFESRRLLVIAAIAASTLFAMPLGQQIFKPSTHLEEQKNNLKTAYVQTNTTSSSKNTKGINKKRTTKYEKESLPINTKESKLVKAERKETLKTEIKTAKKIINKHHFKQLMMTSKSNKELVVSLKLPILKSKDFRKKQEDDMVIFLSHQSNNWNESNPLSTSVPSGNTAVNYSTGINTPTGTNIDIITGGNVFTSSDISSESYYVEASNAPTTTTTASKPKAQKVTKRKYNVQYLQFLELKNDYALNRKVTITPYLKIPISSKFQEPMMGYGILGMECSIHIGK